MRALVLRSLAIFFAFCTSAHSKDLIYIFLDAKLPLESRSTITDFTSEVISELRGNEVEIYLHIDGVKLHFPAMPLYNVGKGREVRELISAVSETAQAEDYFSFVRSIAPDFVEDTTPDAALGVAAKNITEISKSRGPYDRKYFLQFSNLDYYHPKDTSKYLLGDGWMTSKNGSFREFLYGSRSRIFKEIEVFVILNQSHNLPISWFHGRKNFFQKFYSVIGADIRGIRRLGKYTYGGGAILAESFLNSIEFDYQSVSRMIPSDTNLVQIIDPINQKAEIWE